MAEVRLTLEEYEAIRHLISSERESEGAHEAAAPVKRKRKKSAYNRKYAAAFKKVQSKYKKKSGGWKKNGFKLAQRAAHKLCKR
ncbi:MAG: hypothetical protein [Caudoviricetes sp.]|nr:MAG: hypothetical protein [Caudoviricetes sp.]